MGVVRIQLAGTMKSLLGGSRDSARPPHGTPGSETRPVTVAKSTELWSKAVPS